MTSTYIFILKRLVAYVKDEINIMLRFQIISLNYKHMYESIFLFTCARPLNLFLNTSMSFRQYSLLIFLVRHLNNFQITYILLF